MQISPSDREISGKISEDFAEKLQVSSPGREIEAEEENEDDFSFACTNLDGSPISADAIFLNGQIRPTFPLFDQSLLYENVNGDGERSLNSSSSSVSVSVRPPLRKLFVEERSKNEEEPAGPYCEWTSRKAVKEVSPETCKKSNSTGFSKLWRFREFALRSSSDGKDAFVFLNNNSSENIGNGKTTTSTEKIIKNEKTTTTHEKKNKISGKVEKVKTTGEKKAKAETVSSAYERHYVKNRESREGDKRKTYSPYRHEVLGFFTNVNGMSKNVHPF
ncbi:hypothetical protein Ddye_031279 [Dipteronia dyeriana]|uniref:Uncharacterized protein n=1 Tax=Dipteronia dyeriana TaxID=168575 RepID=A0AAD9TI36_9ROSI|nr:hypothetical protein Ddye_031279 [Dipteronia dyeriana]